MIPSSRPACSTLDRVVIASLGVGVGQGGPDREELVLKLGDQPVRRRVQPLGAGQSQHGIQLVDRPVRLDADVVLGNPSVSQEARDSLVPGLRVDFHLRIVAPRRPACQVPAVVDLERRWSGRAGRPRPLAARCLKPYTRQVACSRGRRWGASIRLRSARAGNLAGPSSTASGGSRNSLDNDRTSHGVNPMSLSLVSSALILAAVLAAQPSSGRPERPLSPKRWPGSKPSTSRTSAR